MRLQKSWFRFSFYATCVAGWAFPEATEYFGDSKQMWMVKLSRSGLRRDAGAAKPADIGIDVNPHITRTVALRACTILRAIRLSDGNQPGETLPVRQPFKEARRSWPLLLSNRSDHNGAAF